MKKAITLLSLFAMITALTGCATVFGGHITDSQRTKPAPGQPARQIRVVPLIANVVTGCIWLALFNPIPAAITFTTINSIDWIDHAAYKPVKPVK